MGVFVKTITIPSISSTHNAAANNQPQVGRYKQTHATHPVGVGEKAEGIARPSIAALQYRGEPGAAADGWRFGEAPHGGKNMLCRKHVAFVSIENKKSKHSGVSRVI